MKKTTWISIVLLSIFGLIGWLTVSIFTGLGKAVNAKSGLDLLVYLFGTITFFTIPIGIMSEIIIRIRRRIGKNKK